MNAVRVEAPKNFTFSICQTVKVQEAGTYTLSVAFQGTDTTNVDVRLFLNTLNRSMDLMRSAGVNAQCRREDREDSILLTISIPRGVS